MAQNLGEIKGLLAAHGLRPRHRLGQNFLHDAHQMDAILAAAELQAGELVLEVGPGTGALTERLLEAGARVVAVEIDRGLEPILHERLDRFGPAFTLLVADVLASKHQIEPRVVAELVAAGGCGGLPGAAPRFKLVANLPYQIASPLIANLLVDHPTMYLAIVMLQREVAGRLYAGPGGKDYGPLGVLVQAICEVQKLAVLTPGSFWPQPKVDSALVCLRRRPRALADDPQALSDFLQRLFRSRRKQLGAILGRKTVLPAGIDPAARPEQLTVEQIISLCPKDSSGGDERANHG
jgi:16S rRNA (adenine1518-N6/adenine1519-N6)-dimethyltransferase